MPESMKFFKGGGSLTRLIWFALSRWGWGSEAQKFDIHVHVEEKLNLNFMQSKFIPIELSSLTIITNEHFVDHFKL